MLAISSHLLRNRILPVARATLTLNFGGASPHVSTALASTRSQCLVQSYLPSTALPSVTTMTGDFICSLGLWLIKRTFQPSLLRKKRKHGYLRRSESVGGRKILKRRKAKGRARLFGA